MIDLSLYLDTLDRVVMITIEDTDLGPGVTVPDVDSPVAAATDHELRVRREGSFQWQLSGVQVTWR